MRIEVDQSGRVEETNRPTVVAAANHAHNLIIVSARTKKALLARFIARGKRKVFAVKTFTALMFLALKPLLGHKPQIIIDLEYPGHEPLMKDQLLTFARSAGLSLDGSTIHFGAIGKHSAAHHLAITAFRRRSGAQRVLLAELTKLLAL